MTTISTEVLVIGGGERYVRSHLAGDCGRFLYRHDSILLVARGFAASSRKVVAARAQAESSKKFAVRIGGLACAATLAAHHPRTRGAITH